MEIVKTPIKIAEVYKELFNPKWRHIVYHGGRSSGKSTAVAYALLLRGREQKHRILCTREYQNSISDSVHKLLKDLIEKHSFTDYEVQRDAILNRVTGTEFLFKGLKKDMQSIKSTEGITICWSEESQTITKESMDILIPTIRSKGSQLMWTFNRLTELDPVYVELCMKQTDDTFVAHVNSDTLEEIGQLPETMYNEREKARAGDASLFAHVWLGEPLGQAEMSIIARDSILEAMKRQSSNEGAWEVGVDVARMGNDRTVFWSRKGLKTIDYKELSKLRTTQVCDELERFVRYEKDLVTLKIDDTGVGGGVTDEMMKRGYKVLAINFGGEPLDKDKYPNWISEAWFNMSEIMPQIQLPFNSDLLMELSTRQWKQDVRGRRCVESKNEYKKRGFRSPDIADACIIAYSKVKPKALNILF